MTTSLLRYLHEVVAPAVGITLLTMMGRLVARSCVELVKSLLSVFSNPTVRCLPYLSSL